MPVQTYESTLTTTYMYVVIRTNGMLMFVVCKWTNEVREILCAKHSQIILIKLTEKRITEFKIPPVNGQLSIA